MNQVDLAEETKTEKKAKKFKLYKFVSITVLVVFLLGGLIIFKNDITVENLRYLIKYLDFSSSGAFEEETEIHYHADSSNQFNVFRGDLALVNESGVSLYDRRGSVVMSDTFNMTTPVPVCGDRYLAIYDLGGYQVRIYNSFALLSEKTFSYPVQSVSINEDGTFCVVTSEKSYHAAVFVYDREFELLHQWFSADKFAVDATLSDSGVLNISTIKTVDGDLHGELVSFKIGKKDSLYSYSYLDQMPLSLYGDKKNAALLTDTNLHFLSDGEMVATPAFPDDSLKMVRFGKKLCCVLQDELSVGVNYRLRVFDYKGNEVISEKLSTQVIDIEIFENFVYVLTHSGLIVLSETEPSREISLQGEFSDLGVFSENTVILCSENTAYISILK